MGKMKKEEEAPGICRCSSHPRRGPAWHQRAWLLGFWAWKGRWDKHRPWFSPVETNIGTILRWRPNHVRRGRLDPHQVSLWVPRCHRRGAWWCSCSLKMGHRCLRSHVDQGRRRGTPGSWEPESGGASSTRARGSHGWTTPLDPLLSLLHAFLCHSLPPFCVLCLPSLLFSSSCGTVRVWCEFLSLFWPY